MPPAPTAAPRQSASFRLVESRERVRLAREERRVAADGDEEKAPIEHAASLVLAETEESRRLAGGADALARFQDGGLHIRMLGIGEVAHIGSEVGGTDEDAV